jgi:hypothetical protein
MRASSDPTPMNHSNKDGAPSAESEEGRLRLKENTLSSDTYPTQSGTACVPPVGECADKRTSNMFGRYSSARRTGCANERPSGSVRGAPGNRCPYRDRQQPELSGVDKTLAQTETGKKTILGFPEGVYAT